MTENPFELFDAVVEQNCEAAYDFMNDPFCDAVFTEYPDWLICEDELFNTDFDSIAQADDFTNIYTDNAAGQGDWWDTVENVFDDIYYVFDNTANLLTEDSFTADGAFDVSNNMIVEGNVAHDLQFTQQQTANSCSLMAQEQFVHRYTGQPIPEEYLEWQAEKWGVYVPEIGTDIDGQIMVLEHFNVPFERIFNAGLNDIDNAIAADSDVIIGVDAREFYEDPTLPPGQGHAVAIVGRGIDPETFEVSGYYVTDSNYPESARFVPVDKLNSSMYGGDMIIIPEKQIA